MLLSCTHSKCHKTVEIRNKEAERIARTAGTNYYHECLYAKRELRLMREVMT